MHWEQEAAECLGGNDRDGFPESRSAESCLRPTHKNTLQDVMLSQVDEHGIKEFWWESVESEWHVIWEVVKLLVANR